jgi:hypothetical protein
MANDHPVFWRRDDEDDRKRFATLLLPLVGASRTKSFTRAEGTAYILSMQDVPPAILEEAVVRLVRAGVTWMPKPGDLKTECAKVMAEKRATAARLHLSECTHSSHWIEIDGKLQRCPCWTRAQQAMLDVGHQIALPPKEDDEQVPYDR